MRRNLWPLSFGCVFLAACVSPPTTVQTNGYRSTSIPATGQANEGSPASIPSLSGHDEQTQRLMERACLGEKSNGPVAYGACLNQQIISLEGSPGIPSLSGYDEQTQRLMERACLGEKSNGPVAYGACLNQQITSLQGSPGIPYQQSYDDRLLPTPGPKLEVGRSLILNGEEYDQDSLRVSSSWKCSDFWSRGGTLVEFGQLSLSEDLRASVKYKNIDSPLRSQVDDFFQTIGFVLYDGTNKGDFALYSRRGLNHRWDWGPDGKYSFIIEPDGTGLFYDFTTAESGKKSKADDVFKCER